MAPDFKTFLATEVISEQKTVSYRNLSRALKVHVNAAKCMLYDFYGKENKKKSGSIYATFLVSGKKHRAIVAAGDGETPRPANGDVPMPSSPPPFQSSSMPAASQGTEQLDERYQIPVKSITLCREEQLESVKEQYEHISSIHIYSLSPVRLQDLATLTDTGRAVFTDHHAKQDPLIHNKDYGIIQNPHVWRRKGKRPVNVDVEPAQLKVQPQPQPKKEAKSNLFSKSGTTGEVKSEDVEKEATTAPASRPSSRDSTTTQESKSKPTLKRDGSSLFKAFAKQSANPKLQRKDTDTSDAKMSGMDSNDDEGESEDEAMFLDTGTSKSKKRSSNVQREKEERQAKLRKMMEDDEEAESAVPRVEDVADMNADPPAAKSDEDPDAPGRDDDNVDWSDSDTEKKSKAQAKVDEGPKRRRGKRKVMKKKTMKDDEGFLVTREEEAFESFSEDEPELKPQAKKPAFPVKSSAPANSQSQAQKSSAPKGNAGGGKKKDIMSFFGKK